MEPFIADLINNPKVPKFIRYSIVTIVCLFIIIVGLSCAFNSPFLWGKIFGTLLSIIFLMIGIYLYIKIAKSNNKV